MPKRILIVDDEKSIGEVLSVRLKSEGYVPDYASTVDEALQCIENQPPDLAIIDLMMPIKNGWQLCEHMKKDSRYWNIPIIVLSAIVQQSGESESPAEGDYIMAKPYEARVLVDKIRELIGAA